MSFYAGFLTGVLAVLLTVVLGLLVLLAAAGRSARKNPPGRQAAGVAPPLQKGQP